MKRLIVVLALVFGLAVSAWADGGNCPILDSAGKVKMELKISDCMTCHIAGDFRVRETASDAQFVYPHGSMRVIGGKGYLYVTDIDSLRFKEFFDYCALHKISRTVVEIHSYGGALFEAQRIVGLMQEWQGRGGKVETRLYGMAFSAGFYVFVAGDSRLVAPDADLMWHELQSMEGFGFKVTTPSDKEEGARVLRHLQNVRNEYIATRGKLSKSDIDARVSKKEWWMTGRQAVEFGFADGFVK